MAGQTVARPVRGITDPAMVVVGEAVEHCGLVVEGHDELAVGDPEHGPRTRAGHFGEVGVKQAAVSAWVELAR